MAAVHVEAVDRERAAVQAVITSVAVAATIAMAAAFHSIESTLTGRPVAVVEFLALCLALQLFAIPVTPTGGRVGVGAVGTLAAGIVLGVGPAMGIALLVVVPHWIRTRAQINRTLFDAGMIVLDVGAGAGVYRLVTSYDNHVWTRIAAATLAGVVLNLVNFSLLCTVIGLHEQTKPLAIWRERFRWARFHYLAFGPLALAAAEAHRSLGLLGLMAFTIPPGLLLFSVREYVERTKDALRKERRAKERFRRQSRDMKALFDFAGGLSLRSHDREALVAYAEQVLRELVSAYAAIIDPPGGEDGLPLETGGKLVGRLRFVEGKRFDAARWERIAPAILPHLATAIESADLVSRVWRQHLDTIAALSRSMEAKDLYTGSHTERVATIAVALGKRLGYSGSQLDALEVGALLHDVGKIGIPESILNKPESLDDAEWEVMRQHPVISDRILEGIALDPIVRQIARSSHERYDGRGYPDGLVGEEIPLSARIVLVADALDALTSDRAYRPARHLAAAMQEIRENTGSQFCPSVVAALDLVFREEPHVLGVGYLQAVVATA
jgi:HD-GYP domain-containing protein (c-di-GMP phosphodiesterase class II)